MNAALLELGARMEVPVFELAAQMPSDPRYWVDGRHVTEEGARLKATLFADFLQASGLLGGAGRDDGGESDGSDDTAP
jgi:hypothetical protein